MLELPIGSWVKNGSTTPGQIVDLKIAGRIPEVHVLWWNHTVPVPERPNRLTLLETAELEYIWNGEERPKLIRRIDQIECEEIQVLQTVLGRLAIDKRKAMAKDMPIEEIELYRMKQTYIRKRIAWVNQQDLERLERVVRQGLEIFYRVGEALAEIRDRKLYKDLGYSNFRDYLTERWNMKKSQAYRLIDSAEVVKNLSPKNEIDKNQNLSPEKSVPHGGQNEPIAYHSDKESSEIVMPQGRPARAEETSDGAQRIRADRRLRRLAKLCFAPPASRSDFEPKGSVFLPQSERVAREVGKAPPQLQQEVWETTVDRFGDSPTAKQVKSVVTEIVDTKVNSNKSIDNPDSSIDKPDSSTDKLIVEGLKVGQIVQIRSDRTDKRLVGYNRTHGKIIAVNLASVDLKLLGGQTFTNVSPNDFQVITSVSLSAELSPEQLSCIIDKYGSFQEFVDRMMVLQITKQKLEESIKR